jgi:tripartite-type tricarboxylate transporter receptor subunit TctC
MMQRFGVLLAALLMACLDAGAEEYPTRPITLVVPAAAGGVNDASTRLLADEMKKSFNWSVVVENKPGGNSLIATRSVAGAAPDGYTLLSFGSANIAAPFFYKAFDVDFVKDLTPVIVLGDLHTFVVANMKVPFQNQADMIQYGKVNPGKLSYGSGISADALRAQFLFKSLGADILIVPYRGTAPALTAVLAGDVHLTAGPLTLYKGFIDERRLRAVSYLGRTRSRLMPELPAIGELKPNLPGLTNPANGISGPKGMPSEIVKKLNTAINEILQKPAVLEKMSNIFGFDVKGGPPEVWTGDLEAYRNEMAEVAAAAGLIPE